MKDLKNQEKYIIMRELIREAKPETVLELVQFFGNMLDNDVNIENRRQELLDYLDELHEFYTSLNNENNNNHRRGRI